MKRAWLLLIHRWLGLILAPFLLVQALTGAFLVLHELPSRAPPIASAPVSALRAGAEAAAPGMRLSRLYLPGSSGPLAFAELSGPGARTAYADLDPASGAALTSGGLWRFPYRAAVQVHYRLSDGTAGMAIVLAIGLFLAITTVCGILFWWPGRGRIVQSLKVRRGLPARFRLRQWHRSVGAVTGLVALFSAITGLMLIAPDMMPAPAGPAAALSSAPTPASIDRAIAAAQARFPTARLRDVRFPVADRLDINFDAPERNARATHTISVRLSDGAVLKSVAAQDNPVLWMKVLALHTGQAFALPGMILLLGEALGLLFLAYAGTRMWFAARRKDKR